MRLFKNLNCVEIVRVPRCIVQEFGLSFPIATIAEQTIVHVQQERGRTFGTLDIINAMNLENIEYVGERNGSLIVVSRYRSRRVAVAINMSDGTVRTVFEMDSTTILYRYAQGMLMHVTEMFSFPIQEAN